MDRQSEERRAALYSDLQRQLERLSHNFAELGRNVDRLRDQTEKSQRLAVLHASMFMGAKTVLSRPTATSSFGGDGAAASAAAAAGPEQD
ncbi:hypothetical protein H4R18_005341 [Coemansia javaensis]|uniref:Uncharacterized protein n=1 Tax=Coemansia javaensis TaxID=2761396 RepID=A0A9W8H8W8_9FUNG|nr:hypothetical protein H4R18_005341 [Coemansia javaensis]